jgi:hypothetical protein
MAFDRVASTDAVSVQSGGLRAGPIRQLRKAPERAPSGIFHAFDPDTGKVACGRDASLLFRFSEQSWGHCIGSNLCPDCEKALAGG